MAWAVSAGGREQDTRTEERRRRHRGRCGQRGEGIEQGTREQRIARPQRLDGSCCALIVLALYMLHRARQAHGTVHAATTSSGRHHYMDSIGFVLISLFNGFVVVSAPDLGAPPWLIAGLAVAATMAGHRFIAKLKHPPTCSQGRLT